MILTNNEIYQKAIEIQDSFDDSNLYIPAKLNFYIAKNKQNLITKALVIEDIKRKTLDNNQKTDEQKNKELFELGELEEDVDIKMIPLSWFTDDIKFSYKQMEAIMFMIDENA